MEIEEGNLTEVHYHFFSLKFTPLKSVENLYNSNDIMRNVITYISNQLHQEKKGHLIDRHELKQYSRRELFINRAVFLPIEKRIRCSIALLRNGREPFLKPKEQFKLIPISEQTLGSIAEETHFFIDYSKKHAVICCEYNHFGPRMSDIEYYFRNVAQKVLKQSRATEVNTYLEAPIDETLAKLKNVLNIEIKLQPKNLHQLDPDLQNKYFSGMNNIGQILKPKFIRLEAYYQSPGKGITSRELNVPANKMITEMLNRFRGRSFNIDAFDAFLVKYEDKDGNEEVFNLLSGKKEIVLNVDMKKITRSKDWYALIQEEFNNFIEVA
ncbi:hypothetical protein K6T82_16355 [Flavobacterium sp. 17A]|uniref:Uncharacterized protein n=1 Tax=Flavobacterium potami TaxID=2872310 RepID=A0A9X1HCK8_9FLAO|nr:hypothetical protein [Flavobacterium potami]MBZ4036346.1 hypothetical protein [Flavobacterium potami]